MAGGAQDEGGYSPRGLLLGAGVFAALLLLPAPEGMPVAAWRVVAVAALMATWWLTEALPLAMTALLPLILFPLLGIGGIGAAAAPYADPIIFLFLGGLTLGLATEKWGLHRRLALRLMGVLGTKPNALVLGLMTATVVIGMWVSNTATAAMMLPVTLSIVSLLAADGGKDAPARDDFATALLLGVAFAASIGGMTTIIGTPPNALFAGYMQRTHGVTIGFAQWMTVGVPVGLAMLVLTWLVLTRIVFRLPRAAPPGFAERLAGEIGALPRMSYPEAAVGLVFLATAGAWLFRPLLAEHIAGLDDTIIAVAAALALFTIPSRRGGALLDWADARRLPWGVLLLFGGGLSLAAGIGQSGLAGWVGARLAELGHLPTALVVLAVIGATIVVSELASNTATAAAFLPLAGSIAAGLGAAPVTLALPVALAASCGFMLPVATPPNALFFSTGRITIRQMARAGLLVDLIGAALILAVSLTLAPVVFR